jgi:hypothetical protein
MFASLHDMGPNDAAALRKEAKRAAEATVLELTPKAPAHILYKKLWPQVLVKHAVRLPDVNAICNKPEEEGPDRVSRLGFRAAGRLRARKWSRRRAPPGGIGAMEPQGPLSQAKVMQNFAPRPCAIEHLGRLSLAAWCPDYQTLYGDPLERATHSQRGEVIVSMYQVQALSGPSRADHLQYHIADAFFGAEYNANSLLLNEVRASGWKVWRAVPSEAR